MGKGDKRTKKGKIWRKTYGVSRPRLTRNEAIVVLSKEEKEAAVAAATAKEAAIAEAPKKAAPKKKAVAKKKDAAPKKETAPKKEAAPKAEAKAAPKKSTGKADDLKKIEGIGPKIAETLVAAGLATYAELAKSTPEKISEIIAGVRGNHVTDTWPQQSQLAADGKWDELKVLQDELDGGKKK